MNSSGEPRISVRGLPLGDGQVRLPEAKPLWPKGMWFFVASLPIWAVAGAEVMNATGNNTLILLTYAMSVAGAAIVFLRLGENQPLCAFSLWAIGLSLIFAFSIRSDYVLGYDVFFEYFVTQKVITLGRWLPSSILGPVSTSLAVGILPGQLYYVSGTSLDMVYKIGFAIMFSPAPVVVFLLARRFLRSQFAYAASLFFVYQTPFTYISQSNPRTSVAVLLFAFALLPLLRVWTGDVPNWKGRLLLLAFTFGVVFSHYTTAYIFFILLAVLLVAQTFTARSRNAHGIARLAQFCTLFVALMFFWYAIITVSGLEVTLNVLRITFDSLGGMFLLESRQQGALRVLGIGVHAAPDLVYSAGYYVVTGLVFIGVIQALRTRESTLLDGLNRSAAQTSWPSMRVLIATAMALIIVMVALPHLSIEYSIDRLWVQLLVVLSPAFVFGCIKLMRTRPTRVTALIVVLLLFQFCNATYLGYQIAGTPQSLSLNSAGVDYSHFYMHNEELTGASWLKLHAEPGQGVTVDGDGVSRLVYAGFSHYIRSDNLNLRSPPSSYVFLTYYNVVFGKTYSSAGLRDLPPLSRLPVSEIYNDGGSEVVLY